MREHTKEIIKVYTEKYFTTIIVRYFFKNMPPILDSVTYPNDILTNDFREAIEKHNKDMDIDLVKTWKHIGSITSAVVLKDGSRY